MYPAPIKQRAMAEEDASSDVPCPSQPVPFTPEQCAWLRETFGTGLSATTLVESGSSTSGVVPLLQVGQVTATGMQLSQSALEGQSTPQHGLPLGGRRMGISLRPARLGGARSQHLKAWAYCSKGYCMIYRGRLA